MLLKCSFSNDWQIFWFCLCRNKTFRFFSTNATEQQRWKNPGSVVLAPREGELQIRETLMDTTFAVWPACCKKIKKRFLGDFKLMVSSADVCQKPSKHILSAVFIFILLNCSLWQAYFLLLMCLNVHRARWWLQQLRHPMSSHKDQTDVRNHERSFFSDTETIKERRSIFCSWQAEKQGALWSSDLQQAMIGPAGCLCACACAYVCVCVFAHVQAFVPE